jgi:hypothetical protein
MFCHNIVHAFLYFSNLNQWTIFFKCSGCKHVSEDNSVTLRNFKILLCIERWLSIQLNN